MAVRKRRTASKEEAPAKKAPARRASKKPTKEAPSKKRASKKVEDDDSEDEEYESMKEAKPEADKAEQFKLDDKKQKKRIGFPLTTKDGGVAMVKVHYFKAKFGQTLADGKWHAFQAPTDEDLLEACRKHPQLDEKTERATIVIVYDTDAKGKVYGKGADIGYELLAMKINNPKLIDLQEIDEDDDLTMVDLSVRLDSGKDVKFQDMRFKAEKGDALWLTMDDEEISAEAKALSKKLKDVIAFSYDNDKIEALIGDGDDDDGYDDDEYDDEEYDDDEEIDGEEEDEDEEEEEAPRKKPRKRASRR